ncbi:hypothetical protein [Streptomyces sp. NPDC090021]
MSVKVADRVHMKVLTIAGAVFETRARRRRPAALTCMLGRAAVINP